MRVKMKFHLFILLWNYRSFGGVITCQTGYSLTSGNSSFNITCSNGTWGGLDIEESCDPICEPRCENEGKCVAPDICQCNEAFSGDRCSIPVGVSCNNLPSPIPNSAIQIRCLKKFQMTL